MSDQDNIARVKQHFEASIQTKQLAISTSGNSENVLEAVRTAQGNNSGSLY